MVDQIVDEFLVYMHQHGGQWRDWYVGVASDPKDRLFNNHNVVEQGGVWIHSGNTGTETVARADERHFLDQGCDGGPGGGSYLTKFVYAYKKTAYTNENN